MNDTVYVCSSCGKPVTFAEENKVVRVCDCAPSTGIILDMGKVALHGVSKVNEE